jgi:hypothetical protein
MYTSEPARTTGTVLTNLLPSSAYEEVYAGDLYFRALPMNR